jgi:hypothetical protein
VARGCPDMWVQCGPRMHNVICGCLCRRRAVPVMDAFFLCSFLPLFFYLLLFAFSSFFFYSRANQRTLGGHCLGMVTRADSVTHKYFHRDEKDGS